MERSGSVTVGDRVVGVNGRSTLRVNYERVLQLIDDATSPVRLSFASPSLLPAGTIAVAEHGRAIATRGRSCSEGAQLSATRGSGSTTHQSQHQHQRARASSTGTQAQVPAAGGESAGSK